MNKDLITENLKAHFLRLFRIALSDDHFSELELKMLYGFAESRGIPGHELDKILLHPLDSNDLVPDSVTEKAEYLYDLSQMIWADEQVLPDERVTLEKYVKLFGFAEENATAIADYLIDSVINGKTFETVKSEIL